jgi:hypothetical protein
MPSRHRFERYLFVAPGGPDADNMAMRLITQGDGDETEGRDGDLLCIFSSVDASKLQPYLCICK